ncbi:MULTISPECIES: hypothetical protein [unclassified Gordonia (in: high G+C Gram-positive bacteria)]|nr:MULTISPECIES: hypothetical protein [unclassified Gordonia (in: high G+C Gram-positive bacteria)]MBN0975491.1 hypothetical protein [Gordonia sp. BP-119]MBN0984038.1 hypothetical protein [Gordonia sp. BP-94]OCW85636.1 hypothetical protein A8M60_04865 [Nocardia farcinica]WGJ84190.1 hypothetical protein QAD21_15495 [Gordonia sp. SMJS1]
MKIEPHALTHPRTRTDADWRAEVAALVTPANITQATALHYATALGVIPIKVYAHDGARIPETGTTGAVALPEPATMAAHIAAMDDTHQLGIRLPANIIGIDIDTYDVQTAGGLVHKRGGTTITRLETELGPLPPTLWSTRREPQSDAPHHRTGIRFYRLRERTLRYYSRRGHHFLQLRDIPPHVETIAFSYRYAAVAPTTADGLTYTWHATDGTVIDPLDIPNVDTLAELPDPWAAYLIKPPNTRRRTNLRPPGEPSGGGATYAERADTADAWCAENIAHWTSEPDEYISELANRYITDLGAGSRHLTALQGTHALLRAATGSQEWPGHPGGQKALTKLAEAFLDAKPTPTALGDFNRQFANAVDKLAADIDSGDLRPSPASLVPPRWSTATESSAQ